MVKACIVGAGVVGCYTALLLSDKAEITLIEKSPLANKPCSGLFSSRIFEFFPFPKKLVEACFEEIEINFGKRKVTLILEQPLYAFNRKKLEEYLFSLVKKEVDELLIDRVIAVTKRAEVFLERSGKRKFDRVIACDGTLSTTRKSLGLPSPRFHLGLQCFVKSKEKNEKIRAFATHHGFIWEIPRHGKIEYGIFEIPEIARKLFENFLKEKNLSVQNFRGALIPCGIVISPYSNVFLCGDSAGMCKPWSGGGIIWGFTAAKIMESVFPNLAKANFFVKKIFFAKQIFYHRLSKIVRKCSFILPKKIRIDTDWIFR